MINILKRAITCGAGFLMLAIGAPALWATDFRDAPTAAVHGAVDLEALYIFRDPPCTTACTSPTLVVALTVDALADPLFGPTYHFDSNALYRFYFTARADSQPTANIDLTFGPFANGPQCPAPHAACQTFRAIFPDRTVVEGLTTQGTYEATHVSPVIAAVGNIRVFAGPREDPEFFDQVGFERTLLFHHFAYTGVDAFKGKNASAIVLEFPITLVFPAEVCRGGFSAAGFASPCGAWAVTYQRRGKRDGVDLAPPDAKDLIQIDRTANPLLSLALIPESQKDAFAAGQPSSDPVDWKGGILAQMLALDQALGTCPASETSIFACNPNATFLATALVPDTLKFSYDLPDGFPNGRSLPDRVSDLLTTLLLQIPGFTDGTNPKTYCSGFPFLAPPLQLNASAPFQLNPQACP